MPGPSPAEAVRQFLAPLQQALGCVAQGKITTRRGGDHPKVGTDQQWTLNDGGSALLKRGSSAAGAPRLDGPLEFFATMWWRVIKDDREGFGPYRVTTTGYDYALVSGRPAVEVWAMHWHPTGASDEIKPHLHLGDVLLSERSPISSKAHLRTGRMTFENAIRWLIAFGAEPLHADWEDRLTLAETPHLLFRSWSADPGVR